MIERVSHAGGNFNREGGDLLRVGGALERNARGARETGHCQVVRGVNPAPLMSLASCDARTCERPTCPGMSRWTGLRRDRRVSSER